jgi:O-methyltransferase
MVSMQIRRMRRLIKGSVRRVAQMTGYDIVRHNPEPVPSGYPPDFTPFHLSILKAVKPYTMTSPERIYALIEGVQYITRRGIKGSIVECGVWRGGSTMAVALTLLNLSRADRDLYLFDTFAGMPKPGKVDVDYGNTSAMNVFKENQLGPDSSDYCLASLADVRVAMATTNYPQHLIHFQQGKVEDTIPSHAPDKIALLRLDTDWYESTRHELEHLFPRLSPGGILIIDDYGHWQGARKATDEYIDQHAPSLFLIRIDYTGRIAVKTD